MARTRILPQQNYQIPNLIISYNNASNDNVEKKCHCQLKNKFFSLFDESELHFIAALLFVVCLCIISQLS